MVLVFYHIILRGQPTTAGPSQQGDSRLGRSSDAASAGDRGKERQAAQDAGDNINQKFLEKITWKYMDSVRRPLEGAALQACKLNHRLNPQIATMERLRDLRKILIVTRGLKSNEPSSNSISVHREDLVDRKIDLDKDPVEYALEWRACLNELSEKFGEGSLMDKIIKQTNLLFEQAKRE